MSDIKEILSKYKKIAMVGVSNDPTKSINYCNEIYAKIWI